MRERMNFIKAEVDVYVDTSTGLLLQVRPAGLCVEVCLGNALLRRFGRNQNNDITPYMEDLVRKLNSGEASNS